MNFQFHIRLLFLKTEIDKRSQKEVDKAKTMLKKLKEICALQFFRDFFALAIKTLEVSLSSRDVKFCHSTFDLAFKTK